MAGKAHVRRFHGHHGTSGHVWQGRFKAFRVEDDDHLVTVLRYVERNPLRAELVAHAEDWKWSSLPRWQARDPLLWRETTGAELALAAASESASVGN